MGDPLPSLITRLKQTCLRSKWGGLGLTRLKELNPTPAVPSIMSNEIIIDIFTINITNKST